MYNNWNDFLNNEFEKSYFKELSKKVEEDEKSFIVFPKKVDRLNAFKLTELKDVKVVILGQDPYFNENEAMGLCFSVPVEVKIPPSLRNIYKEIERSTNCVKKENGDLTYLAKQGVFLLNCTLTVKQGAPNSHKNYGYIEFANNVIKILNEIDMPIVFMLWGNDAKSKSKLLNNKKHLVLQTSHPSPLGVYRGFDGCDHFNKANEFLKQNDIVPICW